MFDLYSTWCHLLFNLNIICYLKYFKNKTNKQRIGEAVLPHTAKISSALAPFPINTLERTEK